MNIPSASAGLALSLLTLTSVAGCEHPVDVNDKKQYTHVLSFDGRLNSVDGPTHADVYVLSARTADPMDAPIEQNLIELLTVKGTSTFRWPDKFGAGWCEVVDLDSDGSREFVFVSGTVVRVVSFRDGAFRFRPSEDEFFGQHQIRMIDTDADGRLELLSYAPPLVEPSGTMGSVTFLRWNWTSGFAR